MARDDTFTNPGYEPVLRCKPPSPSGDMDEDHCHTRVWTGGPQRCENSRQGAERDPFTTPGYMPDKGGPPGTDGMESNPPQAVLETASPPWNIRPYMDRNPACEAGPPAREAGVMRFHQFRVCRCAGKDFHLAYGPHRSSTPATLPVLLRSSRPATLLHCLRLLGQHSQHRANPEHIFRHRTSSPLRLSHSCWRSFQRMDPDTALPCVGT